MILASTNLDDITDGFDDMVTLPDLSVTENRSLLFDSKVVVQASQCLHDRFEGRILKAARM